MLGPGRIRGWLGWTIIGVGLLVATYLHWLGDSVEEGGEKVFSHQGAKALSQLRESNLIALDARCLEYLDEGYIECRLESMGAPEQRSHLIGALQKSGWMPQAVGRRIEIGPGGIRLAALEKAGATLVIIHQERRREIVLVLSDYADN